MKLSRLLLVVLLSAAALWGRASFCAGEPWRITVDASRKVADYNPLIQGSNINWVNNGDGLYDPASATVTAEAKNRIRDLGITLLRFPGGSLSEYYDWRSGIGARARRVTGLDYERKAQKMEFGIDEFLRLCESMAIIPVLTVGYANNSPESAAELVEYCNGGTATPMGALRAANGHPEPYRVLYWEIGNEVYHRGISREAAGAYGRKTARMAQAMKKVDPRIKVGGIGLGVSLEWDESVLKECAGSIDFLIYHRYLPNSHSADPEELNNAVIAATGKIAREVRRLQETSARFGALPVAVTEYNLDFRDPSGQNINKQSDIQQALFVAECLRLFQLNGVSFAAKWDLAHISRHYMSDINFNRGGAVTLAPSYHVQKLFARAKLATLVATGGTAPTVSVLKFGEMRNELNAPVLTALAGKDRSGKVLSVLVINRDLRNAYPVRLEVRNFAPVRKAELVRLKPATAERFDLEQVALPPGAWETVTVPAGSVSLYRLSN